MNLQESIRRILREELSPRVRRRIPYDEMEKEFLESFEFAYDLTKKRKVSSTHFLDELIYSTITTMMDGVHWRFVSTLPEDEFWYDDIHTELENHYRDRITQMYNERRGIKESILMEKNEGHKLKFVKQMIHNLYKEISFIEQSTYDNKPLLKIYFDSDDTAANIELWFDTKITKDIDKWTSGNIVVCPTWMAEWDVRKKNADVFIETELLKYDNLGNVINESVLMEDKKPIAAVRRRYGLIDDEFNRLMHKVYGPDKICMYRSGEELVMVVTGAVVEYLYYNIFDNLDDDSKEWEEVHDSIIGYIQYKYGKKLEEYYHINCGN